MTTRPNHDRSTPRPAPQGGFGWVALALALPLGACFVVEPFNIASTTGGGGAPTTTTTNGSVGGMGGATNGATKGASTVGNAGSTTGNTSTGNTTWAATTGTTTTAATTTAATTTTTTSTATTGTGGSPLGTTCTLPSQCASGYCVVDDGNTLTKDCCAASTCLHYACGPTGQCKTSCMTASDCADSCLYTCNMSTHTCTKVFTSTTGTVAP